MATIPNGSREQYRAREQAVDPQRNRLLTRAVLFTRPLRNGRISTRHATGAYSRRRFRTADSAPIQAYGIRPCRRTERQGEKEIITEDQEDLILMSFSRASGILLHPTSLPGRFGIGDLGAAAYEFVDFLEETG